MTGIAQISNAFSPAASVAASGNFGGGSGTTPRSEGFSDVLTGTSPPIAGAAAGSPGKKSSLPAPGSSAAQKPSTPQTNRSLPTAKPVSMSLASGNPSFVNPPAPLSAAPASAPQLATRGADLSKDAPAALASDFSRQISEMGNSEDVPSPNANPSQPHAIDDRGSIFAQPISANVASDSEARGDSGVGNAASAESVEEVTGSETIAAEEPAKTAQSGGAQSVGAALQAGVELLADSSSAPSAGSALDQPQSSPTTSRSSGTPDLESTPPITPARTDISEQFASVAALLANPLRGQLGDAGPSQRGSEDRASVSRAEAGASAARVASSQTSRENDATVNPDLQKEISDMRDELAQQIGSRLQAELVAAPAKSVGGVATSTGAGGNLAGQNSGNAPGNSSAQDTANQSAAATASGAGGHAVDASDATTSGTNAVAGAAPGADLAAELKTAAQLVPAADSVAHVSLDVAAPAASAAAVSTSSPPVASASSNTSVMRPAPARDSAAILERRSESQRTLPARGRVGDAHRDADRFAGCSGPARRDASEHADGNNQRAALGRASIARQ